MTDDMVVLAAFPFHLVHLVSGALQAAGIPVVVDPDTVSPHGLYFDRAGHRVLVPPERLDEARQILAEIDHQPAAPDLEQQWDAPEVAD